MHVIQISEKYRTLFVRGWTVDFAHLQVASDLGSYTFVWHRPAIITNLTVRIARRDAPGRGRRFLDVEER